MIPTRPRYLQVSYSDFSKVIGSDKFEGFCEAIYKHHCQFAVKEGMFVIERFFCNSIDSDGDAIKLSFVFQCVVDYLNHYHIEINPDLLKYEDCQSLAKDYEGVLFDWTW